MPEQATNATTAAAVSAVNTEPSRTLKALAWQIAIAVGLAVASAIATFIPAIGELSIPLLPDHIEAMVGPFLMSGALSAQAWLLVKIRTYHKQEKVEALLKPTPEPVFPPEIDRFYKK